MRALRFFAPGRVAVTEVPDPEPGPGEVVLRVHAVGLCNSDVRVFLGEKRAQPGVIPGHEFTGEVVAAGPGARTPLGAVVAVCPIVACGWCGFCRDGYRNRCSRRRTLGYDLDGGCAEFVRIPRELEAGGHLLPVDPSLPAERRAMVEPLACVLASLEALGVAAGEGLAVVGGGPMGLLHVVAARAMGAGPILVVEPDAERREAALELGADVACAPQEAFERGMGLTSGEGFPAVAVAVGLAEAAPQALRLARKMGRVNLFAGFPPGTTLSLDANQLHYDELRLVGTQNAPLRLYARAAAMLPRLPALDRVVTHRFPLDRADEAYAARLERRGLKGAVVMV
ncbi:D-arabitol-phosphate dehydrogenase [bacterium HR29]|jgi:L-iditol 2-dehydrogenase|nr:D-arabitol-phosphate dehydrogenase [bacterium HR29]